MEIEDLIDKKSRLEQGIFFTKSHIVEDIISHMKLDNVTSVIDSAAGSCNFLIPLALKYPDKQFYGVEKNSEIFELVSKKIEKIDNLHLFCGDILLDQFPIPECDLYLGNPPFINFSDLPSDYREEIKDIWLNYFPDSRGFKMLLGDSRGDIAQLIFYYTIDKYIKDGGGVGVILPNSLIKGNSASAGFREFRNIGVHFLVDISNDNPFDNTERNCFYILAKKGSATKYPIPYKSEDRIIELDKSGDDLIERGRSILKESEYVARQGINTLGANTIFFFKDEPEFDSPLIHPLLKSSDITPFNYSPSYKALIPYENGKPIPEDRLEREYPEAYKYLLQFKDKLENRKSRFAKKCWYALFGIGEYTTKRYKVVWRGLGAKKLMAAVTEDVIPNQAMNCYIPADSKVEADYICGIMNSSIYKDQLSRLNEKGAKSFAQPNTINKIYLPLFNKENKIHRQISTLAHSLSEVLSDEKLENLNSIVKGLYIEENLWREPN